MVEYQSQTLISAIHEQLNRNGLAEDFFVNQLPVSKPDIDEIRLTIAREEKLYPNAVHE
jgi:hypothetical protein